MSTDPGVPIKPTISLDMFRRLDIRVGTIESAEDVAGSKKLVRLNVDFGSFRRRILAGMKGERENLDDLRGVQALFLVNLEPKRMAGEISEGMLLDIGYEDGIQPALAIPERAVRVGVRLT